MPGMMDTVLNLGLNDQTVEGLAKPPATALRLRQLSPLHPDVFRRRAERRSRRVRGSSTTARKSAASTSIPNLQADDWIELIALYKKLVEEAWGKPIPAGCEGAALGRDRRGVRQLDERIAPRSIAA
jgi:pyruvate,orthophosphate dikinase